MKLFGTHIILDIIAFDDDSLSQINIMDAFWNTIDKAGLKCIKHDIHYFYPKGITLYGLLEEGHISIHTLPENRYIGFDIFCCGGEEQANVAVGEFLRHLDVLTFKQKTLDRVFK